MTPRRDLLALTLGDLLTFGTGMANIAAAYITSLAGTARITKLRASLTALQSEHGEWSADTSDERRALEARDAEFKAGRTLYRWVLNSGAVAVNDGAGGEQLSGPLSTCPSARTLKPNTGYLAFESLARIVEANVEAFATVEVTPDHAARLRAHAQALQANVNQRTATSSERGSSSGQRKTTRASLITQLRSMDDYLRLNLPPKGIDALNSHRATFLTRYAQKPKAPA